MAKVMVGTAVDVLRDPSLLERAKADHAKRTGGRYDCPIPKELAPALTGMS